MLIGTTFLAITARHLVSGIRPSIPYTAALAPPRRLRFPGGGELQSIYPGVPK